LHGWWPKGVSPVEDSGFISVTVEARTDIGFPSMRAHMREVVTAVRKDPAVSYVVSIAGATNISPTTNTGRIFIALKPRSERNLSANELVQRLRGVVQT